MSAAPQYHGRGAALYRERAWKCLQLARQARDRSHITAVRGYFDEARYWRAAAHDLGRKARKRLPSLMCRQTE
jgi:hypothetical protein